jgi:hypothetical protein
VLSSLQIMTINMMVTATSDMTQMVTRARFIGRSELFCVDGALLEDSGI